MEQSEILEDDTEDDNEDDAEHRGTANGREAIQINCGVHLVRRVGTDRCRVINE